MSDAVPVRSDRCGLDELFLSYETGDAERARLALGRGWWRAWTGAAVDGQVAGSGRGRGVAGQGPGAGSGGRVRAGPPVLVGPSSASPAGAAVHGVDGAGARVRVAGGAGAAAGTGFHRGAGR